MEIGMKNQVRSCPYDAEVQYICTVSDGGQKLDLNECIDTLLPIDGGKWRFVCDVFVPHDPANPTGGASSAMVGDSTESAAFVPVVFYSIQVRLSYGNTNTAVWTDYTRAIDNWTKFDVVLSDGYQKIQLNDDFVRETSVKYVHLDKTIKIGQLHLKDTGTWLGNCPRKGTRYGKMKIWHNDVLVRDFIPVRIDDEGCMFDRVEWKLYKSVGSVKFAAGPDAKGAA